MSATSSETISSEESVAASVRTAGEGEEEEDKMPTLH